MKRTPLARKTHLRKRSPKRAAYMGSAARKEAEKRMAAVSQLRCLVCGAWPVENHHLPNPRDDMRTVPLCPPHHRREFGPQAYHYSRKAFNAKHGSDEELLARTNNLLALP